MIDNNNLSKILGIDNENDKQEFLKNSLEFMIDTYQSLIERTNSPRQGLFLLMILTLVVSRLNKEEENVDDIKVTSELCLAVGRLIEPVLDEITKKVTKH